MHTCRQCHDTAVLGPRAVQLARTFMGGKSAMIVNHQQATCRLLGGRRRWLHVNGWEIRNDREPAQRHFRHCIPDPRE